MVTSNDFKGFGRGQVESTATAFPQRDGGKLVVVYSAELNTVRHAQLERIASEMLCFVHQL